jgi:hypothetical protein
MDWWSSKPPILEEVVSNLGELGNKRKGLFKDTS